MELRTIPLGTRRRASSAFTDPLYDNCLSRSESSDPGVTRPLPAPALAPLSAAVLPAAVPTPGGRGDGSVPGVPGSSVWAVGGEGWPEPSGDHDGVSCCSTHQSILSLYDNLEAPRSPTEDDIDTDCSEGESEVFQHKNWTKFTRRTENLSASSWESLEDRSRETNTQPNKRTSRKLEPYLFTAAESRPKVFTVPHPFSDTEPQAEHFVRDTGGEVLLQETRDPHTKFSLNLPLIPTPYPSTLPAPLQPLPSPSEVHVGQQSGPASTSMAVLLTSIKQQIARQRDEYETQIRR